MPLRQAPDMQPPKYLRETRPKSNSAQNSRQLAACKLEASAADRHSMLAAEQSMQPLMTWDDTLKEHSPPLAFGQHRPSNLPVETEQLYQAIRAFCLEHQHDAFMAVGH